MNKNKKQMNNKYIFQSFKLAETPQRNARRAEGESDIFLMRVGQETGDSAANIGNTLRLLRSAGVTLAEVLITIGIIGVVSALTIPHLIQENQKRSTITKLQKAISVINQAYKLSYDDVGEPTIEQANSMGGVEYFNSYWKNYLRVETICRNYSTCGYSSLTPYKYISGSSFYFEVSALQLRVPVLTPNGMIFIIVTGEGAENRKSSRIIVDINGGESPNILGKDVFFLERIEENGAGVRPSGYALTDAEINDNCSKSGPGEYCSEKIRRAGWRIEKDYPW
ncbi:type II secretion system protein [bacterium]|nr:type II secretion system protein [bacterium]